MFQYFGVYVGNHPIVLTGEVLNPPPEGPHVSYDDTSDLDHNRTYHAGVFISAQAIDDRPSSSRHPAFHGLISKCTSLSASMPNPPLISLGYAPRLRLQTRRCSLSGLIPDRHLRVVYFRSTKAN